MPHHLKIWRHTTSTNSQAHPLKSYYGTLKLQVYRYLRLRV